MNIQQSETNLLSDDELDAVAGGIRNDPLTTAVRIAELAPSIATSKALGNAPGVIYSSSTVVTTMGGGLGFA
jgi:hypothetical protein